MIMMKRSMALFLLLSSFCSTVSLSVSGTVPFTGNSNGPSVDRTDPEAIYDYVFVDYDVGVDDDHYNTATFGVDTIANDLSGPNNELVMIGATNTSTSSTPVTDIRTTSTSNTSIQTEENNEIKTFTSLTRTGTVTSTSTSMKPAPILSASVQGQGQKQVQESFMYLERDGLVVMEAEQPLYHSNITTKTKTNDNDNDKFISSYATASTVLWKKVICHSSYNRYLYPYCYSDASDNTYMQYSNDMYSIDNNSKQYNKQYNSTTSKDSPVLLYPIYIQTTGRYRLLIRSNKEITDNNFCQVRLINPTSTKNTKAITVYQNMVKGIWTYSTLKTSIVKKRIPNQYDNSTSTSINNNNNTTTVIINIMKETIVYLSFPVSGLYYLEITGMSNGYAMDRILLYLISKSNKTSTTTTTTTSTSNGTATITMTNNYTYYTYADVTVRPFLPTSNRVPMLVPLSPPTSTTTTTKNNTKPIIVTTRPTYNNNSSINNKTSILKPIGQLSIPSRISPIHHQPIVSVPITRLPQPPFTAPIVQVQPKIGKVFTPKRPRPTILKPIVPLISTKPKLGLQPKTIKVSTTKNPKRPPRTITPLTAPVQLAAPRIKLPPIILVKVPIPLVTKPIVGVLPKPVIAPAPKPFRVPIVSSPLGMKPVGVAAPLMSMSVPIPMLPIVKPVISGSPPTNKYPPNNPKATTGTIPNQSTSPIIKKNKSIGTVSPTNKRRSLLLVVSNPTKGTSTSEWTPPTTVTAQLIGNTSPCLLRQHKGNMN